MRCPKCGYISFDHLDECLKCKKDIRAVADSLRGSAFNVQAPVFLQLQNRQEAEASDFDDEPIDGITSDDEIVDDDLDVLVSEDNKKDDDFEETKDDRIGRIPVNDEFEMSKGGDDEEGGIEIDLSQFEDAQESSDTIPPPPEVTGKKVEEPVSNLLIPDELADLSDLAPPARMHDEPKGPAKNGLQDMDMELDLDLDLGLGDLENELTSKADPLKETILALDDIDFSDTLSKNEEKQSDKKGGADMDADLNFDLDLGGLSIHKDH